MANQALAYRQIAERLRQMIVAGQLHPGERLAPEADLGRRFGVGRSTIREALRVLSSTGLLVTRPGLGGGSRVAHPDPKDVGELLKVSITLLSGSQIVSVQQLLQAREILEVPAARLAATNRTAAHLDSVRATIEPVRSGVSMRRVFEANRAFHEVILDASGNPLLAVMTGPVFKVLQTRFLRDRAGPMFWTQVVADHEAMIEAIASADPDRAVALMQTHLLHLRVTYEQIDAVKSKARSRKWSR